LAFKLISPPSFAASEFGSLCGFCSNIGSKLSFNSLSNFILYSLSILSNLACNLASNHNFLIQANIPCY